MTFISGSISSADPGPALYAEIETAALAAGFTFVKTVTIGARTHKILKSPAASNSQGLDWYLDIGFPTTGDGSRLSFTPFEDFDSSTNKGIRGPVYGYGSTIESTYFSRYGATGYELETNWSAGAAGEMYMALSTSSFAYWISVTTDRIISMLSTAPTFMQYAGFYEPTPEHVAAAGSHLFPLIVCKVGTAYTSSGSTNPGSSTVCVNRLPTVTSAQLAATRNGYGWSHNMIPNSTEAVNTDGVIGGAVAPVTAQRTMRRLPIIFGSNTFNDLGPFTRLGHLIDMASGRGVSTILRGDTVTIDSDTWYLTSYNSNCVTGFRGV